MGETVMESNPDAKGWLEQQVTLPNLILLGRPHRGRLRVALPHRAARESKVQAFEQNYVPREVNEQRVRTCIEYRSTRSTGNSTTLSGADQRGRQP
jgi:hypothetical protein